ncbi:MAG: hypothetical protein Q7W16_05530 [Coriobacteriia bacterium]|nr:hypothetical protein [Coriobacteriia bacterium]
MKDFLRRAAAPAALALLWSAHTAFMVGLSGRLPGAALTFALTIGTLVLCAIVCGRDLTTVRDLGPRVIATAGAAGAGGMFLAPYLVVTHRYTDAPPGTEVLFFAGVVWGIWAVLAGAVALWRSGRIPAGAATLAGGLAVLTGAAGILGNWERPSSFSPMVRFAGEELWMIAAGAVFVLAGIVIARLMRLYGPGRPLLVAASAAFGAAAITVSLSAEGFGGLSRLADEGSAVVVWVTAWAMVWLLWTRVLSTQGVVRAGICLTLTPVILPALSLVEKLAGVRGPDPMVWSGVAGGLLLTIAGAVCLFEASGRQTAPHRWARVMWWLAGIVCFAAVVGLFLPALAASVAATRQADVLSFAWDMPGWETVAGWTAASGAALLCASVAQGAWWSRVAALGAVAAYPLLARTPLHVLTRGLSSDIQQDFGTTYASVSFSATMSWPVGIAIVGVAVGLAVLLFDDLKAAMRELTRRQRRSLRSDPR